MKIKNELIRFSVGGTFVGAADLGIYYLLIHFLPFSLSKGISFTCAGIVAYLLNKYWTFEHNQPSYGEFSRCMLINFLALGINVSTNQIILTIWPDTVILAFLAASMLTGLLTFISFKLWVFAPPLILK